MKKLSLFVLFLAALAFSGTSRAQTQITGTFLPASGQTPQAAGLTVSQQIAGQNVCGQLDFVPYNAAAGRTWVILWGGKTYLPQSVRGYIRCSDGALINSTGSTGINIVPNSDAQPQGTLTWMSGGLNASTDASIRATSWSEAKAIPDQSSVDWGTLPVATIVNVGYQTVEINGTALNARTVLNFTGGMTCSDDTANSRTDCQPSGGGGDVNSVFGRTGSVTAQTGDYSFSQISGTLAEIQLPSTTVFTDQNATFGAHAYDFSLSTDFEIPKMSDPGSPVAGEVWINGAALKYEDNAGTPEKHTVEVQDDKGAASGYAGLGSNSLVPVAQLGTGTADANHALLGNQAYGLFVSSFNGRTGAVTPQSGDYSYSQISSTPTLYYQTFEDNGTAQTQRAKLNLIPGSNVTESCVDNSGANSTDCTLSASVTAGSAWSSLGVPSASLSLSMATYQTTFTYGLATGSGVNMFTITDTASNTGTGALFRATTASSSTAIPAQFDSNGNGVKVNSSGLLTKVGTGAIDATVLTGLVPAASIPNPSASTLGGVESLASVSHKWINTISTSGVPSATQPACGDLSDSVASCNTDATNASNISSGILPGARLPSPSASVLGGIESFASVSHEWINGISTSGVPSATQPNFSDLAGSAACGQFPALTGDTTTSAGSCATTVVGLNGTSLSGLASGLLYNTTSTGVPSIATASQVNAVIKNLTGCNTATYVYTPQASDCVAPSGGGANTALSNLLAVSINTSLLAQAGVDLGSTANPFRNLYFFGGGTYGSDSFELTGTSTANRTWTFQDSTDTVVGRATTDTLTNKSIAASEINSGTLAIAEGGLNTGTAAAGEVPNATSGTASSWTPTITLGASGTLGSIKMGNATSGTVTLEPVTGALGTVTASLPANTGTLSELNLAQTWSALQTFGTNISIGGATVGGATGTGNVVFSTSPALTTPNLGTPSALVLTNASGLPCSALPAMTGDATTSAGSCATTVGKINGTSLAGLASGLLYNTTSTGVPSIATSAEVNAVIQNLTGCNTVTYVYTPQAGDCVAPNLGTVTTSGSPASSYIPYFSSSTAVTGTANATLDSSGDMTLAGTLLTPQIGTSSNPVTLAYIEGLALIGSGQFTIQGSSGSTCPTPGVGVTTQFCLFGSDNVPQVWNGSSNLDVPLIDASTKTIGHLVSVGATSPFTETDSGIVGSQVSNCAVATAGSICYWNGSAWVVFAGNNSGTNWLQETASGVPSWTAPSATVPVHYAYLSASAPSSASYTSLFAYDAITATNAVTITRVSIYSTATMSGCGTTPEWGVYDNGTAVGAVSTAIPNGQQYVDSGPISATIAAGHEIQLGQVRGASGCSVYPANVNEVIEYQD